MKKNYMNTGFKEWFAQRISAALLVPLSVWFIYLFMHFANLFKHHEYEKIIFSLTKPINLLSLIFFISIGLLHSYLGIKVILEDYIANKIYRKWSILYIKLFTILILILFGIAMIKLIIYVSA
jgi:succinate dehydrogenase / fumarate reductase membrane anchor subunit